MSQPSGLPSKAAASSRASSASGSINTPTQSSTQQFFSNDSGSRRAGSSSGGGNARSPAPRNLQTSKPKHKSGKKFKALDEDASAEMYSMQNPHGRKGQTSITHLMNFSLPPRPHQQQGQYHRHSYNGPRRGGNNRSWGLGSGYHAVDKAR